MDIWFGVLSNETTAIGMIEGLGYELRMMGIVPRIGSTAVSCDYHESQERNSTAPPESVLTKRHNGVHAIAYHLAHEAKAVGIIHVAWEDGMTNIADLLKTLLPGPLLKELIWYVIW